MAATHYVLGEALDRDPFLLFELRGRTKEEVLDALRAARADAADGDWPSSAGNDSEGEDEVPSVSLDRLADDDYDKPREPMPTLHLSFDTPPVSGAVLRQLGMPAAWSSETSPVEMLGPILRAAAGEARRLALAEPAVAEGAGPVADGPTEAEAGTKAASTVRKSKTTRAGKGATKRKKVATAPGLNRAGKKRPPKQRTKATNKALAHTSKTPSRPKARRRKSSSG